MSLRDCPLCGAFWVGEFHKCYEFTVTYDDDDEQVWATDHESAALKYGDAYDDDGDYPLANGGTIEVEVTGNGGTKRFSVSAEVVPTYYAKELH